MRYNEISKKRLGVLAEDIAVRFLKKRGFRIIERNFYCRFGELDIVAKDGREYVFVEVRSGRGCRLIDPLESISSTKTIRLKRLALKWLSQRQIKEHDIRLDAVVIVFNERSKGNILDIFFRRNRYAEIRHIIGIC